MHCYTPVPPSDEGPVRQALLQMQPAATVFCNGVCQRTGHQGAAWPLSLPACSIRLSEALSGRLHCLALGLWSSNSSCGLAQVPEVSSPLPEGCLASTWLVCGLGDSPNCLFLHASTPHTLIVELRCLPRLELQHGERVGFADEAAGTHHHCFGESIRQLWQLGGNNFYMFVRS